VKTHVYTLNLKPDPALIEEYKAHHRAVWPEVTEALCGMGVVRDEIYLLGTRLVMLLETEDDADPLAKLAEYEKASPRLAEWGQRMSAYQEPVREAKEGEWWAKMERVFAYRRGEGEDGP